MGIVFFGISENLAHKSTARCRIVRSARAVHLEQGWRTGTNYGAKKRKSQGGDGPREAVGRATIFPGLCGFLDFHLDVPLLVGPGYADDVAVDPQLLADLGYVAQPA